MINRLEVCERIVGRSKCEAQKRLEVNFREIFIIKVKGMFILNCYPKIFHKPGLDSKEGLVTPLVPLILKVPHLHITKLR